jgi:soluble lytic murein transglycosylase-like protein
MGIPTRLTIQDYFNKSGFVFQPNKGVQAPADVCSASFSAPFVKALAEAQASSAGKARGLSIQDYMQRRIPSHRTAAAEKVCSAAVSPSPIPPFPKAVTANNSVSKIKTRTKAPPSMQEPLEKPQAEDRRKILTSIDRAAVQFGLPAALIKAVVKAESNYQVRAVSPAGAQGLMQLMPATARELGVTDPFDIDQNIRGGAQYLRNMLDQFDGDLHLALSAYNAGPGTVARYAGNVPYAETRAYVQRVMRYAETFSSPEVT